MIFCRTNDKQWKPWLEKSLDQAPPRRLPHLSDRCTETPPLPFWIWAKNDFCPRETRLPAGWRCLGAQIFLGLKRILGLQSWSPKTGRCGKLWQSRNTCCEVEEIGEWPPQNLSWLRTEGSESLGKSFRHTASGMCTPWSSQWVNKESAKAGSALTLTTGWGRWNDPECTGHFLRTRGDMFFPLPDPDLPFWSSSQSRPDFGKAGTKHHLREKGGKRVSPTSFSCFFLFFSFSSSYSFFFFLNSSDSYPLRQNAREGPRGGGRPRWFQYLGHSCGSPRPRTSRVDRAIMCTWEHEES